MREDVGLLAQSPWDKSSDNMRKGGRAGGRAARQWRRASEGDSSTSATRRHIMWWLQRLTCFGASVPRNAHIIALRPEGWGRLEKAGVQFRGGVGL